MSNGSSQGDSPLPPRHVVYLGEAKVEMAFRLIPVGEFWMGARGENKFFLDEEPPHKVVISQPFWMGETPVTREQFRVWTQVKGIEHENGFEGHPTHPAENLDWHQATGFCDWLNAVMREQLPADFAASLPSEAQWEYACRAGTETEFHAGDGEAALEEIGWFDKNSGDRTRPVGTKESNHFGLHSMHGSVWEWCLDAWDSGAYRRRVDGIVDPVVLTDGEGSENPVRLLRGGSWLYDAEWCRSAYRIGRGPGDRIIGRGFRVCLVRSSTDLPAKSGDLGSSEARRDAETPGTDGLVNFGATPSGRVIDSESAIPDWNRFGPEVRSIIVGRLPVGNASAPLTLNTVPDDLAARFPNLTHLRLWQTEGLKGLPDLPAGLKCLDLRGCVHLLGLSPLPESLEILLLDQCAELSGLSPLPDGGFPRLTELSLNGCGKVSAEDLGALLKAAPGLRRFEASDCPQLESIPIGSWPSSLDRIDLHRCISLTELPARWPPRLRRLGLRGARSITAEGLPREFPASLDYLDLAGTAALRELPRWVGRPRTLFLHGSGIRKPPASEQGADENENVAARTHAYFRDVELLGEGEVRRCKLLILGNGSAGKTCLALRLLPGKDPVKDHPGSTHGVQFWSRRLDAVLGKRRDEVHLHLWDFGGQEIYHNTHRLFMAKGSVFVVLWQPDQDGKQPEPNAEGYQDVWRPLQYWLDLIHLECREPRIAIVCSHHSQRTPELESHWQKQVSSRHWSLPCFYVDSCAGKGEVKELERWLQQQVGEVVYSQGTAVPPYWEIAQSLVESWIGEGKPGERRRKKRGPEQLEWSAFRDALRTAIDEAVATDEQGRYARLAEAWKDGTFELTDDRVDRTLDFLTHSGWVYWDRKLFERRVIIGQQWALDGIYAVLDRRPGCRVFGELTRRGGQFARDNLTDWVWGDRYSDADQRLLLSFMVTVGVCFKLVSEGDSLWQEPVYLSLEHLPKVDDLRLPAAFATRWRPKRRTIKHAMLHEGHWHALLGHLGGIFGTDAYYAVDGFFAQNRQHQTITVQCQRGEAGLGGEIRIQVDGPDALKRALLLEAQARSYLPRDEPFTEAPKRIATELRAVDHGEGGLDGPAGSPLRAKQVFISYAWDPEKQEVPAGYEEPVNAIESALKSESAVELVRDKTVIRSGDDIVLFMQRAKTADKVLVVHSDRYWLSAFCMYEFWRVLDSFTDRTEKLADVMVLIEHERSQWKESKALEGYREKWKARESMPSMLESVTTLEKLKSAVLYALEHQVPKVAALHDRNREWRNDQREDLVGWVRRLVTGAKG
ncbi:MAG: SUMF1/EgtB/PvdO family nonheme iron enzyme [Verrucomicrobiales bacterium]|nr:SUMF1/EgtB/PvdO family nonheme iron enzyme [Verrucomicrobiales bacterium]